MSTSNFRRQDPSAETAPAGESGSSHSTAGAAELRSGVTIMVGDCRSLLKALPSESVHCVVTSPPYFGLRDYGVAGQIGLEPTPEAFVDEMVSVFREVRRVLRNDGTLWLNLGDSYANDSKWGGSTGGKHAAALHGETGIGRRKLTTGLKGKDLIGIPWMVAFALRADGWYLRQDIIWSKPNPMPESVSDRCTKAHEYLFLLSKSARYSFNQAAIAEELAAASIGRLSQDIESQTGSGRVPGKTNGSMKAVMRSKDSAEASRSPGSRPHNLSSFEAKSGRDYPRRNKRSVWEVTTQPFSEAHFATFPPALIEPSILAGCPEGGIVLDPFGGAGTTGLVADRLRRSAILLELNPEYAAIAARRIKGDAPMLSSVEVVEAREAAE